MTARAHRRRQVFGPTEGHDDVFRAIGAPLAERAMRGEVGVVFAFGQTGSGKSARRHAVSALAQAGARPACERMRGSLPYAYVGLHRQRRGDAAVPAAHTMNGLMDLLIEALFGSADADARAVSTDEPLRILGACPRVPLARPDRICASGAIRSCLPARCSRFTSAEWTEQSVCGCEARTGEAGGTGVSGG